MKPSIYPVSGEYPGRLFIMPKPSGDWLREDIQHYRSHGIDVIISMLEQSEIRELSLEEEGDICRANQIKFLNFPVQDRGIPEKKNFEGYLGAVLKQLRNQKRVAIHCRAGIGRSAMLVCCALSSFVGSAQTAVQLVSQARGVEVPDTPEQRAFIETICRADQMRQH